MTTPQLPPPSAQGRTPVNTPSAAPSVHAAPSAYASPLPYAGPPIDTGQRRVPRDRGVGARQLAGWVSLSGAALVAVGSFLPWASVLLAGPVYGIDGDGVITLGVALLVAVLGLLAVLGRGRAWSFVLTLILGLMATGIAAYDLANISAFVSDQSMASLGAGLPVIIVGGVAVMVAAVLGLVRGRR